MLHAVEVTARFVHDGIVRNVLVTGGVGHSTRYLRDAVRQHTRYRDVQTQGRSEAAIVADILRTHLEVPATAITIEEAATNCGENAKFAVEILRRQRRPPRSILLVQDPTMQRRTHACFRRSLRDNAGTGVLSYAPFVPRVTDGAITDPDGNVAWSLERFTALVLGEMRRLHDTEDGYGPRGADFIDHIDIPADVMEAYRRLAHDHPDSTRPGWDG